ncbi:MAG TPA: ABC transporter permease [Anaerolineales bacterium]|nr:ABC transporter permease [Anaerolineales bacterium]
MTFPLAVYLSFKELWRNRARFFLVSLVIALITILVLFIAGLGEGLGTNNRQYLENLDAQLVIFRDKADFVIPASRLEQTAAARIREIEGVADAGGIATSGVAIMLPDDEVLKVALLGVEPGRPGAPEAVQGQSLSEGTGNEVVIDQNVIDRTGIKIGDTIRVRSTQGVEDVFYDLKVIGITAGQFYTFQPSIFVSYATWDEVRTKSDAELGRPSTTVNVVAVRLQDEDELEAVGGRIEDEISDSVAADIATAIKNVPGYSAQQGTIQTQGVFTLLIGILVIGGFFQIQILQKVPQIGVLKAIGASNAVVGAAAVVQIVMVTTLGVLIGAVLTLLLSLGFPPTVPIVIDGQAALLAILALLLIGPLGGLVSTFYAVRIEPLKALRLS